VEPFFCGFEAAGLAGRLAAAGDVAAAEPDAFAAAGVRAAADLGAAIGSTSAR
jgi:hypothetical protein